MKQRFESFTRSQRFLQGRSADGYTGLPWEQVFASSNLAALTNFSLNETADEHEFSVLALGDADVQRDIFDVPISAGAV